MAPGELSYSSLPRKSGVTFEMGEGWTSVTIPSPLSQRRGKILLAALCAGVVVPLVVLLVTPRELVEYLMEPILLVMMLILVVSLACLCTALWMGFTRVVITVNSESLSLAKTGVIQRSLRTWPRSQIGDVRKQISAWIYDTRGRRLAKFDAFDRAEEIWVVRMLRSALELDGHDSSEIGCAQGKPLS